jgi:hypothetical protein
MTPKHRLSAYFVLQKATDLLKTKISDALLIVSVAALIYSLLKGVDFDLKIIFSTLRAETLTLISIGVYILIWVFAHGAKGILRLTETRELAPIKALQATSTCLMSRTATSQADVDSLAVMSTYAFPPQAYSDCDLGKKQNTYATWFATYPNFARLILAKGKSDEVVGFSVVLPIKRSTYLKYRFGHARPWDWDANEIVSQANSLPANEAVYVFFQTFFCRRRHAPKSESPYLTSVVVEHLKSVIRGLDAKEYVIIAPRKSLAGQRSVQNLGFERIGESEGKFPLYEFVARVVNDRDQPAQDLVAAI